MTVSEAVQNLRASKKAQLDIGKHMLRDVFFPLDLLAVATLNRSLCLIAGFCTLIESKNIVAAAPLLRMQLDNCLRFSAAWLVEEPHEFAKRVVEGIPISSLKDRRGHCMTDKYLKDTLAAEYPWLKPTYERSSGYVHLSEKHIFNCMKVVSEKERTV